MNFLMENFNFSISEDFLEIPEVQNKNFQNELKIVEDEQIFEIEFIKKFNILKIKNFDIEVKKTRKISSTERIF